MRQDLTAKRQSGTAADVGVDIGARIVEVKRKNAVVSAVVPVAAAIGAHDKIARSPIAQPLSRLSINIPISLLYLPQISLLFRERGGAYFRS